MADDENLYAAPEAQLEDAPIPLNEAEAIRQEFMAHEAKVRAVGRLCMLLGGLGAGWASILLVTALVTRNDPELREELALLGLGIAIALGAVNVPLGNALQRFAPGARLPALGVTALPLLVFPCTSFMALYVLYVLLSRKGVRVLSDDYRDVIAATPDLTPPPPDYGWVILCALLGLPLGGFVISLL